MRRPPLLGSNPVNKEGGIIDMHLGYMKSNPDMNRMA